MKICPRIWGRLLCAALTSPKFWSVGVAPSCWHVLIEWVKMLCIICYVWYMDVSATCDNVYLYFMLVNRWMIHHWRRSWPLASSQHSTTWWRWNFRRGITRHQSAVLAVICWFTGVMAPLDGFTSLHLLTELVNLCEYRKHLCCSDCAWNILLYFLL